MEMNLADKQCVKDALQAFHDSIQNLSHLYDVFDLNTIQPNTCHEEGYESYDFDYDNIYACSLDEWQSCIQAYIVQFGKELDKHGPKGCPLTYEILLEQLGQKVGGWNLETHPMTGCIGINKGDISVLATPDWDADGSGSSWENGELSIEITDDGNHIEVKTVQFNYNLTVNEMVSNWKDEVIRAGEAYEGQDRSEAKPFAYAGQTLDFGPNNEGLVEMNEEVRERVREENS